MGSSMNGLNEMGNNEIEIEWLKKKKQCQEKPFFRLIKGKIHLPNRPFHIWLALVAELHQTAAVGGFLRH